ncbi:MAG: hypothetical protein RLZZ500_1268 [Bacteroidota bacterium]|jgi:hypothetical protein
MKRIGILFCLILQISCNQMQTPKKEVQQNGTTQKDIYFALSLVFKTLQQTEQLEGNQTPYLVNRLEMPVFVEENASLKAKIVSLFSGDSLHIDGQCKQWNQFVLSQKEIKFKRLIPADELDKMHDSKAADRTTQFLKNYQKKYGNKLFYRISMPIYSPDKNTFYIDLNTLGSGQSFVFQKKNGKWTKRVISIWVS